MRLSEENWDLTPTEHFARARELTEDLPRSGDAIEPHLQRMYMAQRHATIGMVELGLSIIIESQIED